MLPGPHPSPTFHPNPCPWHCLHSLWMEISSAQLCFLSPGPSPQSPSCCFQGMNSGSELGKLWRKLFKGIPRLSVSHFDFYCGTCVLLGRPQILQGSSLGNDIDQCPMVFRNASDRGSWMQLEMLLQKLSDLVWTSDALSDEISEDGLVP
ncbi:C20orf173 isoform 2 [Pongo abelii]|uniref:beta-D-galactosyl-(1->3)-N-acetyl-beta-D-galactosaminide alpha-2,3-sialyltransferase n=1 Tax=Pongo abelii TaxID=9601 RepID=A0A663DCC9_PONAB|nr:C20orf173 isoform 2 [Pongo abelii]